MLLKSRSSLPYGQRTTGTGTLSGYPGDLNSASDRDGVTGTSAYAALAVADAWPGARAIPTTDLLLKSGAEVKTAMPSFPDGGLLISLARSGDSPESVGVVERMRTLFPTVKHLAIVCNAEGRLAHTAGIPVICLDPRTNDRSLAMTGSFSNLVLGGLCLLHHKQMGKSFRPFAIVYIEPSPGVERGGCGDSSHV